MTSSNGDNVDLFLKWWWLVLFLFVFGGSFLLVVRHLCRPEAVPPEVRPQRGGGLHPVGLRLTPFREKRPGGLSCRDPGVDTDRRPEAMPIMGTCPYCGDTIIDGSVYTGCLNGDCPGYTNGREDWPGERSAPRVDTTLAYHRRVAEDRATRAGIEADYHGALADTLAADLRLRWQVMAPVLFLLLGLLLILMATR